MVSTLGHAVRRSVEVASEHFSKGDGQQISINIPAWGKIMLGITVIAFSLILYSLEYTLEGVVAVLTMVETPSTQIALTAPAENTGSFKKDTHVEEGGPAITLVLQKPVTSKIRTTIRHIRSQGGRFAQWRGLAPLMVYSSVHVLMTNVLAAIIPPVIPGSTLIFNAFASVVLVRLHAAWTHTVISMPSTKRFWQRLPAASTWRQLALPAAVHSLASYASLYVVVGFVYILRLNRLDGNQLSTYKGGDWVLLALRVMTLFAVVILSALFIILPATVTLVRVEASLLPEEEETIVPFDRTFAGKVVPQLLGGSGAVSFLDAWRSFNWEARRRLIKLYVKVAFVMFAVMVVMMHVMVFEVWAVMGPALQKMVAQAQQNAA